MTVKQARKLRNTLLIVGIVIMLLGIFLRPFRIIGVVVTLSCLIPHILFNRCPHCGEHLDRSNGDFCPYCGKRID